MKKIVVAVIAVLIVLSGLSFIVLADDIDPGSENDPLVSKSYVDAQIAQLKSSGGPINTYRPVQLLTGQRLIGSEGTEIILRSGEATAIDNGANGVSDITGGKDLMTGQPVIQNHLLLTPRSDGRGIAAITEVWILVRGSYTIE